MPRDAIASFWRGRSGPAMSRFPSGRRNPRRMRRVVVMLGLALCGAWASRVEASPIRRHALHAAEAPGARAPRGLSAFLSGGPELWSRVQAPRNAGPLRAAATIALRAPDPTSNPLVQYLLWRHDLNPG